MQALNYLSILSTSPMQLKPGDPAPSFSLKDQHGKQRALAKKLVIYFYPKDFTAGCTLEIQDFAKLYHDFKQKGFEVYGVSPDSVESHSKFCAAYQSDFPLLSDPQAEVAKTYGAWGKGLLGEGMVRSTFVIENGKITQAWYKVNPLGHANWVLKQL